MKLGLYQHYNGNYYRVIGVARHSESLEELVVYQSLYGDYGLWVRPKEMFKETLEIEGKKKPRFQYITSLFEKTPSLKP